VHISHLHGYLIFDRHERLDAGRRIAEPSVGMILRNLLESQCGAGACNNQGDGHDSQMGMVEERVIGFHIKLSKIKHMNLDLLLPVMLLYREPGLGK